MRVKERKRDREKKKRVSDGGTLGIKEREWGSVKES